MKNKFQKLEIIFNSSISSNTWWQCRVLPQIHGSNRSIEFGFEQISASLRSLSPLQPHRTRKSEGFWSWSRRSVRGQEPVRSRHGRHWEAGGGDVVGTPHRVPLSPSSLCSLPTQPMPRRSPHTKDWRRACARRAPPGSAHDRPPPRASAARRHATDLVPQSHEPVQPHVLELAPVP